MVQLLAAKSTTSFKLNGDGKQRVEHGEDGRGLSTKVREMLNWMKENLLNSKLNSIHSRAEGVVFVRTYRKSPYAMGQKGWWAELKVHHITDMPYILYTVVDTHNDSRSQSSRLRHANDFFSHRETLSCTILIFKLKLTFTSVNTCEREN